MKPTNGIKDKVKKAEKLNVEEAREWGELFREIPIFQDGWTTVEELEDLMNGESKPDSSHIFLINFELQPHMNGSDSYAVVRFYPDNKAEVCGEDEIDGDIEFIKEKNFLNFTGTWEEVTLKIIEVNNFLMNPAPPLKIKIEE